VGYRRGEALALSLQGQTLAEQGFSDRAREAYVECAAVLASLDSPLLLGELLCQHGLFEHALGDAVAARQLLGRASIVGARIGTTAGSDFQKALDRLSQAVGGEAVDAAGT